jgi:hypothetical protein
MHTFEKQSQILGRLSSEFSCLRGGGKRVRTDDPLLAKQVLYQLSYTPNCSACLMVGLVGLEPTTPRLSSVCSNQLSYKPITFYGYSKFHLHQTLFSTTDKGRFLLPLFTSLERR